jgi:NADPH2:quinone reductase
MQVVVCPELGPLDLLRTEERPSLVPGPGEVIVDVEACGVNFVDALMIQGLYQVKPTPPFVPGGEVAGTVSALGAGVSDVALGDRVIAMPGLNGFAEQVGVKATTLRPVPRGMEMATAASFVQSYCTALFALRNRGQLQRGETLLVLGAAGGVGLAAIDVGKAMGARVIAAASTDEKLAFCRQRGADETLNYSREDLKLRAKELSGGGVDMVYDPVGGDYAEAALRATAPGGRYLVIGFAAGEIPQFRLNLILLKSCQVVGVDWGGFGGRDPEGNRQLLADLTQMIEAGEVSPAKPTTYPLARAGEALTELTERRIAGKVVLLTR